MIKLLLWIPFDLIGYLLFPSWYKKENDLIDIDLISKVGNYHD